MRIKIYNKAFNCFSFIEPVFFPKEAGLHWKVVDSGSIFASKKTSFEFDFKGKIIVLAVEIWYYLKMNLWRKIRYQWPYKIKSKLGLIKDEFPF